jgi:hypothetical protein
MGFLKPFDSVHKVISMPRWERDALNSYYSINFSGLVQEQIVLPLIEKKDPDIFAKYTAKSLNARMKKHLA